MLHSDHFSALPVALGVAVIAALLFPLTRHRRKKRSNGASAFGWVLLFLTSGRMPPPPPESQLEQELEARRNRGQSAAVDLDRD
jgi:hypothetical protein